MAYYPSYNDVEHKYFQLHQFFQYFFLSAVTFWSYGVPPLSGWDILNMTYTIWNIPLQGMTMYRTSIVPDWT